MAHSDDGSSPVSSMVLAIDKYKNSQFVVRWAIDHLFNTNPIGILVHVIPKNNQNNQAATGSNGENEDANQIFVPYRGYCARKAIKLKEVILEDNDVSKALLDYCSKNLISSIVVGASNKNAFARSLKFKGMPDLQTTLMKQAPDFCSVYVIGKGKVLSVRPAVRPAANTLAPPKITVQPQSVSDGEQEGGIRGRRSSKTPEPDRRSLDYPPKGIARDKHRKASTAMSLDYNIDSQFGGQRSPNNSSFSDDFDIPKSLAGSVDFSGQDFDFSYQPSSSEEPSHATRDMDAEMRRLKLELKQTMDMYSSACKEALTAKKQANELHQWKLGEASRIEEAKHAEEAAVAMAEMEKNKCKAALEAAEKSQKLAEMEAQRRIQAEIKIKQEIVEKDRALTALARNDVRYRRYTIEEIEEATDEFTDSNKIGEGGYGPVYKGKLDHTPVAIKVLRPDAAQGKKQFQQEIEVLSCIRHPNMVLLLGACPEYGCLVYEYMDNGSLEDRLLRKGNSPPISWRKRFKIAAEIATALLFLHQAKPEPLVHRDLKPANILLDRNYVSKISDVGLARLVPPSVADTVTQYHMTSAAGTFCYIDPEYQQTGMLTTKSDIYSLGIMLLQMITAKPPMGLSHHVARAIERGTFADMLDPAVPEWPIEEALAFAKLSLKCTEMRKKDRPDLAMEILPELNRLRDLGRKPETNSGTGHSPHKSRHSSSGYSQTRGHSSSHVPRSPATNGHLRTSYANQDPRSKSQVGESAT